VKTDMVYLTRGGFSFVLIQVFATVSALGTSIAFANLFPKDAYGAYKYILSIAGIIGTFSLTGLTTAVTQSVSKGFDGSLSEGFRINLKWSFGIVFISFGSALYYWIQGNSTLSLSLIIIGMATPFLSGYSLYGSYLNGKKKFEALSMLSLIRFGLPALTLISVVFFSNSAVVIVGAYFISHTLATYVCYLISKFLFVSNNTIDSNLEHYGKHLSFLGILNVIADQLDKIIVFKYVGAVELAVYSFAIAIPNQIWGVFKSVGQLALPKFANREIKEIQKEMYGKMFRLFLVLFVVTGLYIICAPFIFNVFFPQYVDAIPYSQIFALTIPGLISGLPTTALHAKKAVKSLYYNNMIFAIIKILLLLSSVYFWGVWGVVIARVLYEYIGVIISLFSFSYLVRTSPHIPSSSEPQS